MQNIVEDKQTEPTGLRWLFASTAAAVTGQGAVAPPAPLLAASLTRDPVSVALVAAAAWAPWLVIGAFTGALVDRWNAKLVMVVTDLVRAAIMLSFSAITVAGRASIWILGAAVLLCGVGSCLFDPASQSELPALTDRSRAALARANGTFWTIDTLARTLVGAMIGAFLFAQSPALPFVAQGVLFAISGLLLIGLPRRQRVIARTTTRLLDDVVEGARVLWESETLRRNATCMATYNVAYNVAFATMILLLQRNLGLSARGFGLLLACAALGGVVGGWIARRLTWGVSQAYGVGFVVQGGGWLLVLVAPDQWIAAVGFALVGSVSTMVSAIGGAASQSATPEGMMGRITSVTRLAGIGAAAIGSALSGIVAALGGLSAPVVASAILLALASIWTFVSRSEQ
jgi:MFS family permease